jgi:hypothetical protein
MGHSDEGFRLGLSERFLAGLLAHWVRGLRCVFLGFVRARFRLGDVHHIVLELGDPALALWAGDARIVLVVALVAAPAAVAGSFRPYVHAEPSPRVAVGVVFLGGHVVECFAVPGEARRVVEGEFHAAPLVAFID